MEPDARGHAGGDRGVVEEGSDAGVDEGVDDLLCVLGGDGDDRDLDAARADGGREGGEGLDGEVCDLLADDSGIDVEGGCDSDSLGCEAGVGGDGASEPSDADEGGVPGEVESEYASQLCCEVVYVVSAALPSEASEVAEVLAYLCRRHAQAFAELVGACDLDAAAFHLGEDAHVDGQALDDYVGHAVGGWGAPGRAGGSSRWHVWVLGAGWCAG